MILIESKTHNPFSNIATEEFLLKNSNEDLLFLYRNSPSVIIGKHQIRNLEANIPFTTTQKIPIIRRISGGGSVYHDLGNLNYCIITSKEKAWVDFKTFTLPLISHLKELGLKPELQSKSDIRLTNKKISGNASHIFKNRVLHHGSILYSTNLETLTEVLKNKPSCYKKRTVNSRRSIVTNIIEHLKSKEPITSFQRDFISYLKKSASIQDKRELSTEELSAIGKLSKEKYSTQEWNLCYNANYSFKNSFFTKKKIYNINFDVERGICKTDKHTHTLTTEIQEAIHNVPHETSTLIKALSPHFSKEVILNSFF